MGRSHPEAGKTLPPPPEGPGLDRLAVAPSFPESPGCASPPRGIPVRFPVVARVLLQLGSAEGLAPGAEGERKARVRRGRHRLY